MRTALGALGALAAAAVLTGAVPALAQAASGPPGVTARDGSHDFDFLIGDWKARLRQRVDPLTGSDKWTEYEGYSRTHKLLGTAANLEDFKVDDAKDGLHKHAQTLRLYNPASHQWSLYLADMDKGTLGLPATVGGWVDGRIEAYDYEDWKGRWIFVRYVWTPGGPNHCHFEQAFSTDGGKTWEANWILDLTREGTEQG
jgi:hypothetical protein